MPCVAAPATATAPAPSGHTTTTSPSSCDRGRARTCTTSRTNANGCPRPCGSGYVGIRLVPSTGRSCQDRFPMLGARRDRVGPDDTLAGFRPLADPAVVRGSCHGVRHRQGARPDAWVARPTRILSVRQDRTGTPLVASTTSRRSRVDGVRAQHATSPSSHVSRCPSDRSRTSPASGTNIVISVMSSPCGSRPPCLVGLVLMTPPPGPHDVSRLGTVSP